MMMRGFRAKLIIPSNLALAECLLLALSGNLSRLRDCPLSGAKRTSGPMFRGVANLTYTVIGLPTLIELTYKQLLASDPVM